MGKQEQAIETLQKVHEQQPSDADILYALVTFNRDAGKREAALAYARELQLLIPGNPEIKKLVQALESE